MRRSSLYLTIALLAVIVSIYSCTKKVNGINNDQVIATPYSLFFSDTSGALFNSNDGKTIQHTLFKGDGFPCRAICVAHDNILWAKNNLYLSTNNGVNFNHSYDSLTSFPFFACNNLALNLNQSMIINIPEWNMVYTVANYPSTTENFLGVVFSLYSGTRGTWWTDLPDSMGAIGAYGGDPYTINMTSYTMLKNGVLCGYDAVHNRNFYRTYTTLWKETTANPDSDVVGSIGSPQNRTGIPLPFHDIYAGATSPVDTGIGMAWYSYGHFNNTLIAIDNKNCNSGGAYYSNDTGKNWTKYPGLPSVPLLCVASPFEEICLIGTDSMGLYVLNTNTGMFQQQTNNGLGTHIVVRNIAFKENIYKNGTHQKFVYLATSQGIYQSTDGGHNWVKTIPGNFVAVY